MPTSNPLNGYAAAVAAAVSVLFVAAAIVVHLAPLFGVTTTGVDTGFLDNVTLLIIGVVFGTSGSGALAAAASTIATQAVNQAAIATATAAGAAQAATAAHARLDVLATAAAAAPDPGAGVGGAP